MVLISVYVMLYAPGCGLACMYSLVICIRAVEQCMYGGDCVHSKVLYAWYSIHMLATGVVRPVEELLMLYAAEAQGLYHRL